MKTGFILSFLCLLLSLSVCDSWDYKFPETWSREYPACGGQTQSPINIVTSEAVPHQRLGNFTHSHLNKIPERMTLKNNGHTVQVDLTDGFIIADDRLLPGVFQAAQFHLHWARRNGKGSEHSVNGQRYWGEIHIVLYNTKYEDLGTAADKPDGLAVLGFFITDQVGSQNNGIGRIANIISGGRAQYKGETVDIHPFPISYLLQQTPMDTYYRYKGSLTTPPCYESVTWTVFSQPISIKKIQAKVFEAIVYENERGDPVEHIYDNYRPVQPLNTRTVNRHD
ncbi:carbonic anhydrase 2-like [Clavelina lepadiformis]|uniref:carbonic anhydrase 2-like n=1 Tax=Clavelina lepadiformis TaxID=159417 RepID=UPI00404215A1